MAWEARFRDGVSNSGTALSVSVYYVDDADPNTTLYERTFSFDRETTNAQMRAAIITEGQVVRALRARAASLTAVLPASIAIP